MVENSESFEQYFFVLSGLAVAFVSDGNRAVTRWCVMGVLLREGPDGFDRLIVKTVRKKALLLWRPMCAFIFKAGP